MTDFYITLFFGICSALAVSRLVDRFLKLRRGLGFKVIAFLMFIWIMINVSWVGDENPLLLFPFFIGMFLLCYQGPWHARLVCGVILFCLLEPLCMMIDTASFDWSYPVLDVVLPGLAKTSVSLGLWLLARRFLPQEEIAMSKGLWTLLGSLSAAPLFSILSFTIWQARNYDYQAYEIIVHRIAYTVLPFTMLSAAALLVAIVVLARHERLEEQHRLAELQAVYYQGLRREQEGVKKIRHDLHNHLAAVQILLADGQGEAAGEYLAKLSRSPALMGSKEYCEHSTANALLNAKVSRMSEKGIAHELQVSLPADLDFPETELCALLGNALDNAIESAEQAPEKKISLRARRAAGMLMIKVVNTFRDQPQAKNNGFLTTKADTRRHGLGFASMQEIAARHGGICEATFDEETFSLVLSIPLEGE